MHDSMTRRVLAILIAGVVASAAAASDIHRVAAAVTNVDLHVTSFGRILVDPASSQIFVSTGSGNSIVVLSLTGTVTKTITGETGAGAMVVHGTTLYVTLSSGAIDRVNTATLTETSTLVTGLTSPRDLSYAGSKLWTTTGACTSNTLQLASVDPAAVSPSVTTYTSAFTNTNGLSYCAAFATNHAANPGFLLAWDLGLIPATATVFDVSSGSPVQGQSASNSIWANLQDVAVNPDGTHFATASGSPYEFDEFALSNLAQSSVVYAGSPYPTSIDTSGANGGVLVGGLNSYDHSLYAYQIDNPAVQLAAVGFGGFGTVPSRGVAVSPDGSTVYGISGGLGSEVYLNLVPLPAAPPFGSPAAPTNVTAAAGVGYATVNWTAPADPGKSALTGYKVSSSGGALVTVAPTVTSVTITGLSPTSHTFTVRAMNSNGTSFPSAPSSAVTPTDGGTYNALTPVRILDTRNGNGGFPIRRVSAGSTINLQVTGRGGVPATGVSGVVLNVTVTNPTGPGYVTAYPAGAARPLASNLNYVAGLTVPNLVQVAVGSLGQVDLFVGGSSTDLVADVEGWVGNSTDSYMPAGLFVGQPPSRILDTRTGNGAPLAKLGPNQYLTLQVAGRGSLPSSHISAVVLNVTVTNPTQSGFLTVYPTGATLPVASNLNFVAGQTVPNRVIVPLGTGGQVTIFNGPGSVDVVADANGWFTDATGTGGTAYVATVPGRLFDSRSCRCGMGPGYVIDLQWIGQPFITTFVLNVTATNTSGGGYMVLYPDDGSLGNGAPPLASDINYRARQTVPNLTIVALDISNEAFNIYNGGAWADVVVDGEGYYGSGALVPALGQVIVQASETGSYMLPRTRSPRIHSSVQG
jgi:hypothetical protein